MKTVLRILVALGLAIVPSIAEEPVQPAILPAGSLLRVRLKTTLSDKTNKQGDKFTAMVYDPLIANGEEIIPAGSMVYGHIAFLKESGRIKGVAQMRLVADSIVLPEEELRYNLNATLEDAQGVECQNIDPSSDEGIIKGCGKSAKKVAKNAAIGAGIGAAGGLTVGLATRGGCSYYYGCWPSSGPGVGSSVLYGAGIGVGTSLIYSMLKHNKHIILVQGSELTFVINRSVGPDGITVADAPPPPAPPSEGAPEETSKP